MEKETGKERRIYEKVYEIQEMHNYATLILNNIYKLLRDLKYNDEKIAEMLHRNNIKEAGQVSKKDVIDVINNGNIREKTTAIAMFINNCYIIINLICMKDAKTRFPYINHDRLRVIKNKLKRLIGTKDDAVLFDIIKPATTKDACALCNVVIAPETGVLLLSRVVGFPFGCAGNLRRSRPQDEQEKYKVLKILKKRL